VKHMSQLKTGDPLSRSSLFGPLARIDLLEEIDRQVRGSVELGAKIETGGRRMDTAGYYYEPTVMTRITPCMPVFSEETFGPVLPVLKVATEAEAVEMANKSPFGLGGSLWTNNTEKGIRLARQIEAGAVFVNGMTKSDPRLPFGGIKKSGYGRELSHYGIKEFVNIKTIWVA